MSAWVLWTLLACGLAVGEMLTMGLYLAPFAAGAAAAALVGLLGAGGVADAITFIAASLVLFAAIRPLARRHRRLPPSIRTGTAALVGQTAVVLERIANQEGIGCVKLNGEVWTARAFDDDSVIEAGNRVHVMEIRGATALVSE